MAWQTENASTVANGRRQQLMARVRSPDGLPNSLLVGVDRKRQSSRHGAFGPPRTSGEVGYRAAIRGIADLTAYAHVVDRRAQMFDALLWLAEDVPNLKTNQFLNVAKAR
ncbi:hypothetical protein SAMN05216338_108128 [Bradyrhizobium sp. Rc2d]|nr:hypothetical protein SAMN05216338_108128 [Bradyrhizobium sp. Rc2d]